MEGKIINSSSQVKKTRESNLELYRILLMLAIVSHHYVVNSGLMDVLRNEPLSMKNLSFYWFGMWGKTGINCFVLITGYFMCCSNISLKKFQKLLLEIEFYNLAIFFIFVVSGYDEFVWKDFIRAILPVKSVSDGFTSCFILFYLFIPFLNILVRNMNKQQHLYLVLLCLVVFSLFSTIPKINVEMNYVEWFCILYFMASYIRLYDFPKRLSPWQWGGCLLFTLFLSMMSVALMVWLFPGMSEYYFVSDSNHIMAVVVSVCAFMTFKTMKIPYSKVINTVVQSVFGVLLIHANSDTMRKWLWKDLVDVIGQYHQQSALTIAIATVIGIFVICIIIDYIRIRLFERPLFTYLGNVGKLNICQNL